MTAAIHIRRSHISDLPTLRAIARLEDRELPPGTFLVAEVGGSIVAAAALDTDAPPLGRSCPHCDDLQHLLRLQASFLARSRVRNPCERVRRPNAVRAARVPRR